MKDNGKMYFFAAAKRNAERKKKAKEERNKTENKYGERVEFGKESKK